MPLETRGAPLYHFHLCNTVHTDSDTYEVPISIDRSSKIKILLQYCTLNSLISKHFVADLPDQTFHLLSKGWHKEFQPSLTLYPPYPPPWGIGSTMSP